ncbi:hypothetical protein BJ742DRAFT_65507 [Cladochytrium replicatum]|nr:hypothetical protein BJ742DRAFT_65507 [Cladochytrium replicatum]
MQLCTAISALFLFQISHIPPKASQSTWATCMSRPVQAGAPQPYMPVVASGVDASYSTNQLPSRKYPAPADAQHLAYQTPSNTGEDPPRTTDPSPTLRSFPNPTVFRVLSACRLYQQRREQTPVPDRDGDYLSILFGFIAFSPRRISYTLGHCRSVD